MGRLVSCRVVLGALETHGARLMERVLAPSQEHLPSDVPVVFQFLLGPLVAILEAAREFMIQADRQNRDQVVSAATSRRLLNSTFKEVSPLVSGLRDAFRAAYGSDTTVDIGFASRQPERADEMFEQAQHLLDRLAKDGSGLPESRFSNVFLDPANLAAEVEPQIMRLGEAVDNANREARQAESTKLAKDDAVAAFDRTFLWAARCVESMFKLVELDEIAKRVRPSTRRPGVTVGVSNGEEPTTSDESEPPADETEPTSGETEPASEGVAPVAAPEGSRIEVCEAPLNP